MRRLLVLVVVLVVSVVASGAVTPLDEYVGAADGAYGYTLVRTDRLEGATAYVLDMTSQTWRSDKEVNRTRWRHWMVIVKPDTVSHGTALLHINGGSNEEPAPKGVHPSLVEMAVDTRSVVAEIRMVPNQPLVFAGESRKRYEDAIIAYTFDKYVQGGDDTWPLLLPMVKSVVRGMDTVHHYVGRACPEAPAVDKFVLCGASKRGWTTWLTAAVDRRVVGIVPLVIDVLNMDDQMRHHRAAYGFYSTAIKDYEDMDIFSRLDTPRGLALQGFIDPYNYRQRYTMPKFVINSAGDQFFCSDSAQFYYGDLMGEKLLRYMPNTDHGLGGEVYGAVHLYYKSILEGYSRPQFSWRVEDGRMVVTKMGQAPEKVLLWRADNEKARDFRMAVIGKVWQSTPLEMQGDGTWAAELASPEKGFSAYFVELTYKSPMDTPWVLSTEIVVRPGVLPFAEK